MFFRNLNYLYDKLLPQDWFSTFQKICFGSLLFVSLKSILVWFVARSWDILPWANYAIVTVSITLIGWVYHSKVSFRLPLTKGTLWKYLTQAFVIKTGDYILYNVFVYVVKIDIVLSVVVTGSVIFIVRILTYFNFVFKSD